MSELQADISLATPFARDDVPRAIYFLDQARTTYADAMRRILLDDDAGVGELESLAASLSQQRVALLSTAILQVVTNARHIVTNPLWIGDHDSFLGPLDEIQTNLASLRSDPIVTSDPGGGLRQLLRKAFDLLGRLDVSTRKAKYRLPIQVLVWGTPILAGLAVSGRFTWFQNVLFLLALVTIAIVSRWIFSRTVDTSAEGPRLALAAWFRGSPHETGQLFTMLIVLLMLVGMGGAWLAGYVITRPMLLKVSPPRDPNGIRRGSDFLLNYTVAYAGAGPAFDVSCDAEVPGFEVLAKPPPIPAVGDAEAAGSFKISVPESIPTGTYSLAVTCSFKLGKRSLWEKWARLQSSKYTLTRAVDVAVD